MILLPVLLPLAAGLLLLVRPLGGSRTARSAVVLTALLGTAALAIRQAAAPAAPLLLWEIAPHMPLYFQVDGLSGLFSVLTACIWLAAGVFALRYMEHEGGERRFFVIYLLVLAVLLALDYAGSLITFYIFYELVTLASFLLVVHSKTHEAVMAGLKYLFYSVAGAFLALLGIFFLFDACTDLTFTPGGVLHQAVLLPGERERLLAALAALMLGFSAKAGMFPLHGWLPAAHPVAPAPASAVLSGIITKAGVLGLIRVIFYIVGPDFLRGTWVQAVYLGLALVTVLMGSMMAYLEPALKKRLAYSTVSQVSYVLFGVGLMHPLGLTGALCHVLFHAVAKCGLFLEAGAFIYQTGRTRVDGLRGVGKHMPVTLAGFALCALALVGIPPASGFYSKWLLATGALDAGVGVYGWLGPAVLLVSALLTAGYLFPPVSRGFFPGEGYESGLACREAPAPMAGTVAVLALLTLVLGIFTPPLTAYLTALVGGLF